jgi:hypothetical protein
MKQMTLFNRNLVRKCLRLVVHTANEADIHESSKKSLRMVIGSKEKFSILRKCSLGSVLPEGYCG